jgi:hypothetical protein
MKYITKAPGFPAEVIESESITLADMQHAVEGLIATAYSPVLAEQGIDMFCNDEGLLMRLQPHLGFEVYGHPTVIVGGVVLVGHDDEGETIGLTDEQIAAAKAFLKEADERLPEMLIRATLGV